MSGLLTTEERTSNILYLIGNDSTLSASLVRVLTRIRELFYLPYLLEHVGFRAIGEDKTTIYWCFKTQDSDSIVTINLNNSLLNSSYLSREKSDSIVFLLNRYYRPPLDSFIPTFNENAPENWEEIFTFIMYNAIRDNYFIRLEKELDTNSCAEAVLVEKGFSKQVISIHENCSTSSYTSIADEYSFYADSSQVPYLVTSEWTSYSISVMSKIIPSIGVSYGDWVIVGADKIEWTQLFSQEEEDKNKLVEHLARYFHANSTILLPQRALSLKTLRALNTCLRESITRVIVVLTRKEEAPSRLELKNRENFYFFSDLVSCLRERESA